MICCIRLNVLWFLLLVVSGGLSITKNLYRPPSGFTERCQLIRVLLSLLSTRLEQLVDISLFRTWGSFLWSFTDQHEDVLADIHTRSFQSVRGRDHEDLHRKFSQLLKHLAKHYPWSCNFYWRNESWFITPQHSPTAVMHITLSNFCKIFHFL